MEGALPYVDDWISMEGGRSCVEACVSVEGALYKSEHPPPNAKRMATTAIQVLNIPSVSFRASVTRTPIGAILLSTCNRHVEASYPYVNLRTQCRAHPLGQTAGAGGALFGCSDSTHRPQLLKAVPRKPMHKSRARFVPGSICERAPIPGRAFHAPEG